MKRPLLLGETCSLGSARPKTASHSRALFTDLGVIEIRLVGKIKAFARHHSSREWIPYVNSRSVQSQKLSLTLVFEEPRRKKIHRVLEGEGFSEFEIRCFMISPSATVIAEDRVSFGAPYLGSCVSGVRRVPRYVI